MAQSSASFTSAAGRILIAVYRPQPCLAGAVDHSHATRAQW